MDICFRSLWELQVFRWCDLNPDIEYWSSEEIVIPYVSSLDGTHHRYFCDLLIKFKSGATLLVEIKPKYQTKAPEKGRKRKETYLKEAVTYVTNSDKWNAAHRYAQNNGWRFQVWTEEVLQKLGIYIEKAPKKPIRSS